MARRRRSKSVIPGVSFSWRRALGVTNAKHKIARYTGIPTTKSGRQRKAARILTGGGCLIQIIFVLLGVVLLFIIL